MVEEFYQVTLELLARCLDEVGAEYRIEDGDVLLAGHRLGVSIAFDGFTPQDGQVIAPLDIQLHLDGDDGNLFRVGAFGVGDDEKSAGRAAVREWFVLAAQPILEALGAVSVEKRRAKPARRIGGWRLFAGQAGVRGQLPADTDAVSRLYRELLQCVLTSVSGWPTPQHVEFRSIYLMATCVDGRAEVQAAQDGLVNNKLSDAIAALNWPPSRLAYLYKQLFVLRGDRL